MYSSRRGSRPSFRDHMLAYESQRLCSKLVPSLVKKPKSEFRHPFLELPTPNAQATAKLETGHPSPYPPHLCRHELSTASEDAASAVSPKGEDIQSGCWHREHNIFTVTSEYTSWLTAHLSLDGQPSTTSQCLKYIVFQKKA